MLRLRKVKRTEFFAAWSVAWWVASALFVGAILLGYWFHRTQGVNLAVCPMRLAFGLRCPMCGGTHATVHLLRGEISSALSTNPLATLFVAGMAIWTLLYLGFGQRVETTLPAKAVSALILLSLVINWAYLLTHPAQAS